MNNANTHAFQKKSQWQTTRYEHVKCKKKSVTRQSNYNMKPKIKELLTIQHTRGVGNYSQPLLLQYWIWSTGKRHYSLSSTSMTAVITATNKALLLIPLSVDISKFNQHSYPLSLTDKLENKRKKIYQNLKKTLLYTCAEKYINQTRKKNSIRSVHKKIKNG